MFSRTPPLMAPMVTTAGSRVRSISRLTMVCSPSTTCAAVTMGSTPNQGIAPWVWRPLMVIFSLSELAISSPAVFATLAKQAKSAAKIAVKSAKNAEKAIASKAASAKAAARA